LNDVISATSVDTGKVMDIEMHTKYYQGHENVEDNEEKWRQHKSGDACNMNYCGVRGDGHS
jgi:hypothetical protein